MSRLKHYLPYVNLNEKIQGFFESRGNQDAFPKANAKFIALRLNQNPTIADWRDCVQTFDEELGGASNKEAGKLLTKCKSLASQYINDQNENFQDAYGEFVEQSSQFKSKLDNLVKQATRENYSNLSFIGGLTWLKDCVTRQGVPVDAREKSYFEDPETLKVIREALVAIQQKDISPTITKTCDECLRTLSIFKKQSAEFTKVLKKKSPNHPYLNRELLSRFENERELLSRLENENESSSIGFPQGGGSNISGRNISNRKYQPTKRGEQESKSGFITWPKAMVALLVVGLFLGAALFIIAGGPLGVFAGLGAVGAVAATIGVPAAAGVLIGAFALAAAKAASAIYSFFTEKISDNSIFEINATDASKPRKIVDDDLSDSHSNNVSSLLNEVSLPHKKPNSVVADKDPQSGEDKLTIKILDSKTERIIGKVWVPKAIFQGSSETICQALQTRIKKGISAILKKNFQMDKATTEASESNLIPWRDMGSLEEMAERLEVGQIETLQIFITKEVPVDDLKSGLTQQPNR